jgi:hypothetical protein
MVLLPERGNVQMLESTVELVGILFLGVPPLLVASSILGSIVAALRAVNWKIAKGSTPR